MLFISLMIAGCVKNNPDSTEDTATCGSCDDSGVQNQKAELVIDSFFQSRNESCNVIIGNETVGTTGEKIEIPVGEVTEVEIGILDGPKTIDGLPLHVLGENWDGTPWEKAAVVTPKQMVTGDPEKISETSANFNVYLQEYWTCVDDVIGRASTEEVSYVEGNGVHLPGIGDVIVDGVKISLDDYMEGEFESPSSATLRYHETETSTITYNCFSSKEDGTPLE